MSKFLGRRESGVTTPPNCSAWGSPIFFGATGRGFHDLGRLYKVIVYYALLHLEGAALDLLWIHYMFAESHRA